LLEREKATNKAWRARGDGRKGWKNEEKSNAGSFEKTVIQSRFLIGFKLRFFGWGPWRRLFPEFAMPQNLFDYQWFLDKRDDLHLAPAWFDKLTTGLGHFRGSSS
jgi:hypothetical protein